MDVAAEKENAPAKEAAAKPRKTRAAGAAGAAPEEHAG